MSAGFWKLPTGTIKTPISLFRDQATALSNGTKGILVGDVQTQSIGPNIYISMSIVVPNLNNYRVEICTYTQPLAIYPGVFRVDIANAAYNINDEAHLIKVLENTLGSNEMQRILESLYSQASTGASG